jgi:BNR/Asp-box repeat protein
MSHRTALTGSAPQGWRASAQDAAAVRAGADWIGPLVSDPVSAIFVPAGGALLVQTAEGLLRSDDAGATMHMVQLPPGATPVEVDPTNANVLYATGAELLYRSADGGATWQPLLRKADYPYYAVRGIAVSPADHNMLYAAIATGDSQNYRLVGSSDVGLTWSVLQKPYSSLCSWNVDFIQGHPSDAQRILQSVSCRAGRVLNGGVEESRDGGRTFSDFWNSNFAYELGFPKRLVGGEGSMPKRWYLATNADGRVGGAPVLRSDTWNVEIHGLAYDASNPDTVYVARTAYPALGPAVPITSGVGVSTDGGQTWSDLASQQLGKIADLALSADRNTVYVASDLGLFSLTIDS